MNKKTFADRKLTKIFRTSIYYVLLNIIIASALLVFNCAQIGLYGGVRDYESSTLFKQRAQITLNEISLSMLDHDIDYDKYAVDKTNFRFSIYDIDGNYIGGNSSEKYSNFVKAQSRGENDQWVLINIYYGVDEQMDVDDEFKSNCALFNFLNSSKYLVIILFAVCCIAIVINITNICVNAGRTIEDNEIHLLWIDKIPFDGLVFSSVIIITLLIALPRRIVGATILQNIISIFIFELAATLFIVNASSLARREKLGAWFNKTIIYQLCTNTADYLKELSFSFKYVAFVIVLLLAVPIVLIKYANDTVLIIYLAFLMLIAVYYIGCFKRIKDKTNCLINGQYDQKDDNKMFGELKSYSRQLDRLSNGLKEALENQMKSERLKIELITNVSHDIKTPLTSIINYVDLLGKPHTKEENEEYLEVLNRQTNRLKKLSEDVIEITKASTGNIHADLNDTNANELITQALGEYQERLANKNLEVLVSLPSEDVNILADGNLLWRVLNNCFSNVMKYSKENTRVYIDGTYDDKNYVLQIKNISANQLNISAETLMERFVRGERSRNSEGSGLGLNIAKSLTDLQGGCFDIEIDGDLFKVTIKMPLASNEESTQ